MSQKRAAMRSGMSLERYAAYEEGRSTPSGEDETKLRELLCVMLTIGHGPTRDSVNAEIALATRLWKPCDQESLPRMADPAKLPDVPTPKQVLVPVKHRRSQTKAFATWGQALTAAMDQAGMSPRALADQLHRGLSVIYQWRNDRERPGPEMIEAIGELFPSMRNAPEPVPSKTHNPRIRQQRTERERARRTLLGKDNVEETVVATLPGKGMSREATRALHQSRLLQLEEIIESLMELAHARGASLAEIQLCLRGKARE